MKTNVKVIGYGLWVIGMLLVGMPTMAQDWQSTSAMQGTGSNYAPQVTAVGATGVSDMATTTDSYSPAKAPGRPRRTEANIGDFDGTDDPDTNKSTEFPIGDAVLPLMLFAGAFCGVVYFRRRKAVKG